MNNCFLTFGESLQEECVARLRAADGMALIDLAALLAFQECIKRRI